MPYREPLNNSHLISLLLQWHILTIYRPLWRLTLEWIYVSYSTIMTIRILPLHWEEDLKPEMTLPERPGCSCAHKTDIINGTFKNDISGKRGQVEFGKCWQTLTNKGSSQQNSDSRWSGCVEIEKAYNSQEQKHKFSQIQSNSWTNLWKHLKNSNREETYLQILTNVD